MSSFFIDKTDPQIAEILERLQRVNRILHKTLCVFQTNVRKVFNKGRFTFLREDCRKVVGT